MNKKLAALLSSVMLTLGFGAGVATQRPQLWQLKAEPGELAVWVPASPTGIWAMHRIVTDAETGRYVVEREPLTLLVKGRIGDGLVAPVTLNADGTVTVSDHIKSVRQLQPAVWEFRRPVLETDPVLPGE